MTLGDWLTLALVLFVGGALGLINAHNDPRREYLRDLKRRGVSRDEYLDAFYRMDV